MNIRALLNDLYLLTVKHVNEYMSCLCVHKSLQLGNDLFSRYVPINNITQGLEEGTM